ncbi:MAG TPA: hypothetical protein VGR14_10355, partial [Verrucomicrobiae bacterium]|nr:hypothetical protein [Verrucomicrobiae bacterium]
MITASVLWLSLSLAPAQLLNVDFNENDGVGWGGGGPNPSPTMSGAAVLGAAGDLWNGMDVSSGTNIALNYANGNASPVTLTFTSGGGYDVNSFGGSTPFASTSYDALMENYLFNSGMQQTITLAGLATNAAYNLVLYNAANSTAGGRTTYFTVNGVSKSSTWDGVSSTLVPGIDYVDFSCAMSDSSGKLVIAYRGDGT